MGDFVFRFILIYNIILLYINIRYNILHYTTLYYHNI